MQIRPLRTAGGSTEFSELILDEVRVPTANRVGEENEGWRVAMVTFSFERGTALIGEVVESRNILKEIAAIARATPAPGSGALRRAALSISDLPGGAEGEQRSTAGADRHGRLVEDRIITLSAS